MWWVSPGLLADSWHSRLPLFPKRSLLLPCHPTCSILRSHRHRVLWYLGRGNLADVVVGEALEHSCAACSEVFAAWNDCFGNGSASSICGCSEALD